MDLSADKGRIRRWLSDHPLFLSIYAAISAFCLYSCVYAFRKTFAVAIFEGQKFAGIDFKIWLVTFQVAGYAASKFAGIKIISELKAASRSAGILICVGVAGLSWLLFAMVPAPYNIVFLFMNGFPLGLVWGMVFGYLEGRRNTDFLGASLAVSFIFSAGLCKTVGGYILRDWGVSESWMPFVASMVFLGPLLLFLWLLNHLPAPSAADELHRTKRQPMTQVQRKEFISNFLIGLVVIVVFYTMLTAFRDFRDNFSADIWKSLGYGNSPEIFTATEIPVSIACLIMIGSLVTIRNNRVALHVIHWLILAGSLLVGIATWLFQEKLIGAPLWMTLIGLGLYMGYIPFNSSFFDRLLATFHIRGTVGFVMYLADSFGYLGSVAVLFYKQFGHPNLSWLEFFSSGAYFLSILGSILVIASMVYFSRKWRMFNYKAEVSELPEPAISRINSI